MHQLSKCWFAVILAKTALFVSGTDYLPVTVALLNMNFDTKYIDYLLEELHPDAAEYRAFVFYCLIYCVDFMGERGTQFLDKTIPVNDSIIRRLNDIFDILLEEWNNCA